MPLPSPFDPSQPFPPPLTPGEFGRAWVESLHWNQPQEYETLLASGQLATMAREKEAEGQAMFSALMKAPGAPLGGSLPPDAQLGQMKLRAREQVMDSLRVPEPSEPSNP